MLHTLFRKSKAAEISRERVGNLPTFAGNSGCLLQGNLLDMLLLWMQLVMESHFFPPEFSLKRFGFSKEEMQAVTVFGLHFLPLLHTESEIQRKAEVE